ncbi:terpenoid synthase [Crassisporium funariophilum]|nr:terpenoid synthase [Crassisporium funariophilum]
MPAQYTIPDLLATWPWPQSKNPLLDEVSQESTAWVKSMNLFEPAQFKKFNSCNFNLLAAFVGPLESKAHLRSACDLMNFYFAFDEYTDMADKNEAMKIADDVMDAFRHRKPEAAIGRSSGCLKITEMARQFFERTLTVVGEDCSGIERFITDFDAYTKSVIQEADDRSGGHIRSIKDYFELRRDTCGAKPSFSFFALGLNIPTHVYEDPVMLSLIENATDLIAITNDMHSYGLEHSRGLDGHNVITAIMHEHHLGFQKALVWLSVYSTATIKKFFSAQERLPSWGTKIDDAVKEYINRVGRCVRGYDSWSYETQRYYGRNGLKIQKHRRITLQPPKLGYLTKQQLQESMTHGISI